MVGPLVTSGLVALLQSDIAQWKRSRLALSIPHLIVSNIAYGKHTVSGEC